MQPIDQISTVWGERETKEKKRMTAFRKKGLQKLLPAFSVLNSHWFQFHSHFPPSPVFSMLLKSSLSSLPTGNSFGNSAAGTVWLEQSSAPGDTDDKEQEHLVDYVRFDTGMTEGSWDLSQDSHIAEAMQLTCLVVMHPVQNDFWSSVPACNHVAGHLSISVSCQTEVQDLQFTKARERRKGRKEKKRNPTGNWGSASKKKWSRSNQIIMKF